MQNTRQNPSAEIGLTLGAAGGNRTRDIQLGKLGLSEPKQGSGGKTGPNGAQSDQTVTSGAQNFRALLIGGRFVCLERSHG